MDFKNIHIGALIEKRVQELSIEPERICNFLKCREDDLIKTYNSEDVSALLLLRWSKLLEYDFFRLYTQHLILFSPPGGGKPEKRIPPQKTTLPQFRKNIYTKEIIDFLLEMIETGQKTKQQVIEEYTIPKTTLYKWIEKRRKIGT